MSKAQRIAILAMARDCAPSLPRLFALLDHAETQGFGAVCRIGENGSRDGTRELVLARATVDPRVALVPTDAMGDAANRFARMALGREILRIAWASETRDDDFVCVVDSDGVLPVKPAGIDLRAAAETMRGDAAVAGVSAASHPFYYDLLALRAPGLFNYDIGPALRFARRDPLLHYLIHARLVYPTQRVATRALPLATASSFNGMCLYHAADYRAASYCRLPVVDACEHVDFNDQVCAGGRHILAGRWFDLEMPQEHGPRGLAGFVWQRFRKMVSQR